MTRIDVSACGLESVDAVHCVLDQKRTFAFLEAIERALLPGDVVVEAGMGTGIMAVMAAALGGEVYGIEINRETLELARGLLDMFIREGLIDEESLYLIEADASSWTPPRKIDLIISENIYAGMFYEMQIPIINNLLSFRGRSCRVIPDSMCSYAVLSQTEIPGNKRHGESFSPSAAECMMYKMEELSAPVLYDTINFNCRNDECCDVDLVIPVKRAGCLNSMLIYSPVRVATDIILRREDMIFMGEDIFIVIDSPLHLSPGENVRLKMRYRKGSKPEEGRYFAEVLPFKAII
jgi:predicted RNA methylase